MLKLSLLLLLLLPQSFTTRPAVAPGCRYASADPATARFLQLIDSVFRAEQQAYIQTHTDRQADFATDCFQVATHPGDFLYLLERQRNVSFQAGIQAEYGKPVGKLAQLRVVQFKTTSAAQACQAALYEARQWARTQPYNPEFIEPLQTQPGVFVSGPYLLELGDAARGYPELRHAYAEFRSRLYAALRQRVDSSRH